MKKKGKIAAAAVSTALIVCIIAAVLLGAVLSSELLEQIEKKSFPLTYSEYVSKYAEEYGVDEYLIYAVIKTESGFNPDAVSNVQARGLMQITEETFAWIKLMIEPYGETTFDAMFDPETNIKYGVYYISRCIGRYGDIETAIAAYHSGWGTVDSLLLDEKYSTDGACLHTFPYRQMNNYVYKVTGSYEKYKAIYIRQNA